jgi:predicted amidophosphoribosyltransferase
MGFKGVTVRNPKQHRKGRRISRKLANLTAISEHIDSMCSGCMSELTEADLEAGQCTQCGTPIVKEGVVWQTVETEKQNMRQP